MEFIKRWSMNMQSTIGTYLHVEVRSSCNKEVTNGRDLVTEVATILISFFALPRCFQRKIGINSGERETPTLECSCVVRRERFIANRSYLCSYHLHKCIRRRKTKCTYWFSWPGLKERINVLRTCHCYTIFLNSANVYHSFRVINDRNYFNL